MDTTQIQAQEDILRMRKAIQELAVLGVLTPETVGTYEQTILQIWKEAERRRVSLQQQAEVLRKQAAAADAQAGAFSAMASIMFSVVHGFVEVSQKRALEDAERARDAAERGELPVVTEDPKPARKRGPKLSG